MTEILENSVNVACCETDTVAALTAVELAQMVATSEAELAPDRETGTVSVTEPLRVPLGDDDPLPLADCVAARLSVPDADAALEAVLKALIETLPENDAL